MQAGAGRSDDTHWWSVYDRRTVRRRARTGLSLWTGRLLDTRLGLAVATGRQVVRIAGDGDERKRLAYLDRARLRPFDCQVWSNVGAQVVAQAAVLTADFGGDDLRIDQV